MTKVNILTSNLPSSVVVASSSSGPVAWAAGPAVSTANTIYSNAGSLYLCNTTHTNAATFAADASNFTGFGSSGGAASWSTRVVTGTDTVTTSDHVLLLDATTATFTETLPTAVGFTGIFVLKAINANITNLVTVATTSAQTIDGATSASVGPAGSAASFTVLELVSDGANWRSI